MSQEEDSAAHVSYRTATLMGIGTGGLNVYFLENEMKRARVETVNVIKERKESSNKNCKDCDVWNPVLRSKLRSGLCRLETTVWKCSGCAVLFSSSILGQNHLAICGADKIITEMTTELLIQCQYCNRTFSEEDEVLRHQRTHTTEKNYECVDCQLGFDMYMLAEYHWLKPCTAHSNEFCLPKVILCEVCKMHFVSHHDLYYHKLMMGHHGLKLYVESVVTSVECDGVDDVDEPVFADEVMIMLEEGVMVTLCIEQKFIRRYQCVGCPQIFATKTEITEHQADCKCVCRHCIMVGITDCGFDTMRELECHIQQQHQQNPFKCCICDESFAFSGQYLIHIRRHQGIKPFGCPFVQCFERYTELSELSEHVSDVHIEKHSFKCDTCSKSFRNTYYIHCHKLIQSIENELQSKDEDLIHDCKFCYKSFKYHQTLWTHNALLHPGESTN
ncbi:zinc finger protein 160 [Aethina tumida]|uniref:zinc finger protein 160 n=1 Tax=Aethina tumida TaxID=116153 RepID=UPI002148CC9A|nr:zinc finger protein 160 [Aethina tumida]